MTRMEDSNRNINRRGTNEEFSGTYGRGERDIRHRSKVATKRPKCSMPPHHRYSGRLQFSPSIYAHKDVLTAVTQIAETSLCSRNIKRKINDSTSAQIFGLH